MGGYFRRLLGGPNFHELAINAAHAPVHNNQRDGMHRKTVNKGRVAYEPNSLGGGCPFQTGNMGFMSFPQKESGDKVRGKPEKFADHYSQATLFWNSQTDWEKDHIIGGFSFELSKLTVPAIQERMLSMLVNVSVELALAVAKHLGMEVPAAMPKALDLQVKPEVLKSPSLSLTALPGECGVRTRKVTILLAHGIEGKPILTLKKLLKEAGVVPTLVASQLGLIETSDSVGLQADATFDNSPNVLFDGVILPSGLSGAQALSARAQLHEFVVNQYRHGKTIMALGESKLLLEQAGVFEQELQNKKPIQGVLVIEEGAEIEKASQDFIEALAMHRHFNR